MKTSKTLISLVLLCVVIFQTACVSRTTIRASDPAAKIYVNGNYVGQGTGMYQDSRIVGASNSVRLEKDGCQVQTGGFSRDEEFAIGPCIGGFFVLFPFLWIMKYQPEHNFPFDCKPQPK